MATLGDKVRDTLARAFDWAIKTLFDDMEAILAPQISGAVKDLQENPEVPAEIKSLVASATGKKGFAFLPILAAVGIMIIYPMALAVLSGRLRRAELYSNRLFRPTRLDPRLLTEALLRERLPAGQFEADLSELGFREGDIGVIRDLAQEIPGPQDLIRMAVREAFSPEIIEKFELGRDFPPELAAWAAKKGLSAEWAKRYWYAHWVLPSAGQGFEMLHRNVIDSSTLDLLLRTQDVMPFWREKLTRIAYQPLTRVDVRRMFQLGVLDREAVKRAYSNIGYNEENAELMTQFTIKYQAGQERDLTKGDILAAYRKKTIDRETTLEYLKELDYTEDDAEFLLAREDAGQATTERDLTTSQYKALYLAGLRQKGQVTAALANLGYDQEEILALFELWDLELVAKVKQPTRAELTHWLDEGIITEAEFRSELRNLGYDAVYVGRYLKEFAADRLASAQREEERARKEAERVEAAKRKTKYETDRAKLEVQMATVRVFIARAQKQLGELGTEGERLEMERLELEERQGLARLSLNQQQQIANLRLELKIALRGVTPEEKAELEMASLEEIQAVELLTLAERVRVAQTALEKRASARAQIVEARRKLQLDIQEARAKIEGKQLEMTTLRLELLEE